jgi:hypothetical protein
VGSTPPSHQAKPQSGTGDPKPLQTLDGAGVRVWKVEVPGGFQRIKVAAVQPMGSRAR